MPSKSVQYWNILQRLLLLKDLKNVVNIEIVFFAVTQSISSCGLLMCFNSVALRIKGELVHPNKTALKRYVHKRLSWLLGSDINRNLVTSLSFSSSWMCRNAFSMSLDTVYLPFLDRISISEISVTSIGVDSKGSFGQGESADCRQLQSYTILIGVVKESFFTRWCGM